MLSQCQESGQRPGQPTVSGESNAGRKPLGRAERHQWSERQEEKFYRGIGTFAYFASGVAAALSAELIFMPPAWAAELPARVACGIGFGAVAGAILLTGCIANKLAGDFRDTETALKVKEALGCEGAQLAKEPAVGLSEVIQHERPKEYACQPGTGNALHYQEGYKAE